ncbi:Bax inhibitor-1/YccA family protein [Pseudahrensia aquimaris]|uniref:Bax inhibitor-1/YccA family protein n=1 Tax=Pseudahrensia aquimaris TaxID=744461 RepID=A0ABW3FDZ4_9HYPH
MADLREQMRMQTAGTATRADIDQGLRSYMLGIYNYMASALAVTGIAALATANLASTTDRANAVGQVGNTMLTQFGAMVYTSPLKWVIMLAPLAFILVLSFGLQKLSKPAMTGLFYAFATLMGVSMSYIFMIYTPGSIVQTFFVTAAAFGGLSLYGYTTKRSLSGMGTFLMMGLIGLIIAMVVNLFLASSALQFAISAIGVLIFAGLTAWDTQRLKHEYDVVAGHAEMMAKSSIMGALSLYLNFVNMFQFLLSFMGNQE